MLSGPGFYFSSLEAKGFDTIFPGYDFTKIFFLRSNPLAKIKAPLVFVSTSLHLLLPSQASPESSESVKGKTVFSRNTKLPERVTSALISLSHLGVFQQSSEVPAGDLKTLSSQSPALGPNHFVISLFLMTPTSWNPNAGLVGGGNRQTLPTGRYFEVSLIRFAF